MVYGAKIAVLSKAAEKFGELWFKKRQMQAGDAKRRETQGSQRYSACLAFLCGHCVLYYGSYSFPIHSSAYNTPCIARPFTAGIKISDLRML